MNRIVANALLFQLMWFVCVQGNDLLVLGATVVALVIHARFLNVQYSEWLLIGGFTAIGFLLDSMINTVGWILFAGYHPIAETTVLLVIAPPWLFCLWLMFSTTLCHSLLWLNRYPWLAIFFAGSAVPLSYYFGGKLSGSVLVEPIVLPLITEAIIWAILLPVGLAIAGRIMIDTEKKDLDNG